MQRDRSLLLRLLNTSAELVKVENINQCRRRSGEGDTIETLLR